MCSSLGAALEYSEKNTIQNTTFAKYVDLVFKKRNPQIL